MMMSGLLLLLLPGCATECALVEPSEGYRLAHEPPAAAQMPPNVLIVLSDDQGVDQVGAYGVNPDAPPTPNIDSLAAQGVLFRQAWSAPTCSPSRASLLTGRHSQRTGFGGVNKLTHEEELSLDEITIAEMLVDAPVPWTTSVLGKWHLASYFSPSSIDHPNLQGFDHFAGSMGNLQYLWDESLGSISYFQWEKVVDGEIGPHFEYATTDTIDDAIVEVNTLPEPWLVFVSLHAPHGPIHVPPSSLHTRVLSAEPTVTERYAAMVESLDTELGRLLDALGPDRWDDTLVIFAGDNGTSSSSVPSLGARGKNSPYESGIHIPLIVAGPQVVEPGSESDALVHLVDVFATVADVAGVGLGAQATGQMSGVPVDGRSLLPHLRNPASAASRDRLFTSKFLPNNPPYDAPVTVDWRMTRSDRLKIIEWPRSGDYEVYDLIADARERKPIEDQDLRRDPDWTHLALAHNGFFGRCSVAP